MVDRQLKLDATAPQGHLLQFYQADERVLGKNVGDFLSRGLEQGESALVIADTEHSEAFNRRLRALGNDPEAAKREGRLCILNPEKTLAKFMVDGQPDWKLFRSTIFAALGEVRQPEGGGVRAYGEMVGLLWKAGQFSAAIRLEEFWNKLLASGGLQLFCGYPIDIFDGELQAPEVHQLLCAHTHFAPVGENDDLELAVHRAAKEILGLKQGVPENAPTNGHRSHASMPKGEALILSLRMNYSSHADEIVSRARHYYQSEKRFRALVENSSDAVSLIDPSGEIVYASASTRRVLGHDAQELRGRNWLELIHPSDIEPVNRTFHEIQSKPRFPIQVQMRVRQKDGQWRWMESECSNLLDEPDIRAIVVNFRDISERKAAEEKNQRDAEELARCNAELEAFAYAAAHDLKEPLRTVCAFTQLLVESAQLNPEGQQHARFVVEGVKRMSALLDDLLSYSSYTISASLSPVELRDAAERAIANLKQAILESGAAITLEELPVVQGRPTHVVELFQNLIGNAIKYQGAAPVQIRVMAEPCGREWVVKIQDNGIGIPAEYRDRVFGLFKRLNTQEKPGTGIGLAICKKIVESMGGRIWIESAPGQGSTFCFTASAVSSAQAPAASADEKARSARFDLRPEPVPQSLRLG